MPQSVVCMLGSEEMAIGRIRIDNKFVGDEEPVFIVAEAGVNHNGSIVLGKKLVDVAKNAGADAVKFQTFKTERIATEYAKKADYQKLASPNESHYEMLRKLELNEAEVTELFNHAKKKGVIFLSSAFDEESVDMLNDLGLAAFKIASGEITNLPLLKHIAEKKSL